MKYAFPFNLVSASPLSHILINICTKEDLLDLCNDYQIACSKSLNKTELSKRIETTLLKYPEQLSKCLPLSDLQALNKIVQAGGTFESKEPLLTSVLEKQMLVVCPTENTPIGKNQKEVFRYAIAQNLQNVLKPIIEGLVADPKLKILDKNERLLLGFLRLYGVLSEPMLREIWEKTTKETLDPYDLIQLFHTRIVLKQEFIPFYAENKLCFAPVILDFPWDMYEKIKKRSDLEYALYPIETILSFVDSPFFSKNAKIVPSLMFWLNNKNKGDDMLTAVQLGLIWESTQTERKSTELLQDLLEISQWDSVQNLIELMTLLADYSNNTPHWLLKGHTPSVLYKKSPINLQDPNFGKSIGEQLINKYQEANSDQLQHKIEENMANKNVGRNDPCPCNSGKKYKKCCGAN